MLPIALPIIALPGSVFGGLVFGGLVYGGLVYGGLVYGGTRKMQRGYKIALAVGCLPAPQSQRC